MNAYEVKAGIGVIAGKTVLPMPEPLACTTKISAISIHLPLPFSILLVLSVPKIVVNGQF